MRGRHQLINEYHQKLKPQGKVYIFLDEVQEITNWEKLVNSLSQDYTCEYDIFITGSNANLLSSELSTYLSGRYISFEIYPFSFSEFTGLHSYKNNKENYLKYLQYGGIPESFLLKEEEQKVNYISSLRDSIVLKDIIQRHHVRDATLLERLIDFLIDSVGSLFSINKIVKHLKSTGTNTNLETVSNYLEYLVEVYFIHKAQRFELKGKKIFSREQKYYMNDLSFKYYLSSSFDRGMSRFLENAVYLHYKRLGYKIFIGTIQTKEIDFVIEKGNDRKYIQVAYLLTDEKVINREFGNLELIKDNYEKIVVSLDDINFGNINGIKHIQAWEL